MKTLLGMWWLGAPASALGATVFNVLSPRPGFDTVLAVLAAASVALWAWAVSLLMLDYASQKPRVP